MFAVLAGGVGAARFLRGLIAEVGQSAVTAVVNVADDFELHGLWICPDLDTVLYTLTNQVGDEGWGRKDDSLNVMHALAQLSNQRADTLATPWFRLGDKDIATHLYRTQRMREGAPLSTVTRELCSAMSLRTTLLPATDSRVQTIVDLSDGRQVAFQEYFVGLQHAPDVARVRFEGAESAHPASGVLDTVQNAETIFIAPSNPFVSIDPIFSVAGIADAVRSRRDDVIAISPIVDGRAIKGPAAQMMGNFGYVPSVVSVARIWSQYASTLVVDVADAHLCHAVEAQGMRCVSVSTLMSDVVKSRRLAAKVLRVCAK